MSRIYLIINMFRVTLTLILFIHYTLQLIASEEDMFTRVLHILPNILQRQIYFRKNFNLIFNLNQLSQ